MEIKYLEVLVMENDEIICEGKTIGWADKLGKYLKSNDELLSKGRKSVLEDFDKVCMADAFLGFTTEEFAAVKKFFAVNKEISGWDK